MTLEEIRKLYNEYPNVRLDVLFNTWFGFKYMPNYDRGKDDDALLKSLNSRFQKRSDILRKLNSSDG